MNGRECQRRRVNGHLGERYLADELVAKLPTGFCVRRMASEGQPTHPFDLIIEREGVPYVGIENKDLAVGRSTRPDRLGTRITRPAIKRKLAYVDEAGLRLALTTITVRHNGQIGWLIGLVNRPACVFNYDVGELVDTIKGACQ
jgi:hypothetical protein